MSIFDALFFTFWCIGKFVMMSGATIIACLLIVLGVGIAIETIVTKMDSNSLTPNKPPDETNRIRDGPE